MSQPDTGRRVVNSNIGLTNIIEDTHIDTTMCNTFKTIRDTLSDHCGPYGKFAILADPSNIVAEPKFTKDGINIVRAMEFMSVMEMYVRDRVGYIGQRVEKSSGDGTTSSMIISCSALEGLRKTVTEFNLSYKEFTDLYTAFVETVCSKLGDSTIKIDDDSTKEEVYRFIFNQAYTSSHGNTELADLVAQLFSETPSKGWNNINTTREFEETDTKFLLEEETCNYSIKTMLWDNSMCNDLSGTKVVSDGVELWVSSLPPIDSHPFGSTIIEKIETSLKDNKNFALIIPVGTDSVMRGKIDTLLNNSSNNCVSIYQVTHNNPRFNDIGAIATLMGVTPFALQKNIAQCENVSISYEDRVLKLNNLYEVAEGAVYHPDIDDETKVLFHELKAINEVLTEIDESRAVSPQERKTLYSLKRMYNMLSLVKRKRLVIGGAAYDNQAAMDVVDDVLKASLTATKEGLVLGGNSTLHLVLHDLINEERESKDVSYVNPTIRFAEAFIEGIKAVNVGVAKYAPSDIKEAILTSPIGNKYDVITRRSHSLEDIMYNEEPVIVQPSSVDKSLLSRFGEVAGKFVFINRIIMPNSVVTEE